MVDPHNVYPLIGRFLSVRARWALYFWGTAVRDVSVMTGVELMSFHLRGKLGCDSDNVGTVEHHEAEANG